ncbi:MAG: Sialidase, partial [Friedmanniella sp.]|nr:Sialidase [Friedmanniella sp.]
MPLGYVRDGRYGAYGIVSDDHGRHWSIGWNQPGDDQRIGGTVAELSDGTLLFS